MKVTVVGLGLIGGSIALTLRDSGFADHVIGVDKDINHCEEALALGLINEVLPLEEAVKEADLIILAIPVDAAANLIAHVLDHIKEGAIVTDMGSTKSNICSKARQHPRRGRFVAAHPIAGTENTGPEAAFNSLFQGKVSIICEQDASDEDALACVEEMYSHAKMNLVYMTAAEHDKHLAYVSHLSHITSFTLGLTVLEVEKSENNIFNLAGSGFASTARLAKSSPDMWAPIFKENKDQLLNVLDEYMHQLQDFRQHIAQENDEALKVMMHRANDIRRIIPSPMPATLDKTKII
ncbi:MAG: prephenate dehydrogenase [Bacteroidota bacterium]